MSSGQRLVYSAATRRALLQSYPRWTSNTVRGTTRSRVPFQPRNLPSNLPALAILAPRRGYATETTTQGGDGGPPPGFNIDQAKKPLPREESKKSAQSASADSKSPDVNLKTPIGEPTAVSKTAAMEKASLSELAAEKATGVKGDEKQLEVKKDDQKKLTIGQKIKKELQHYWDGTKLLATEVRISSRLALKMAAGYELSRRENRQLQRTVEDLGRLVPFSVFVIVPFAELLLPVALKLFPNLLPSTYEGQKSKEDKAAHLRKTRNQVSTFLRDTLRETGLPVAAVNTKKEEFTQFFRKVRATGESPTPEDVIKVCKIFKDDLTLDNLSRPQLVAMCRYMNLSTFGTDAMLRYHIRHRMRQTKRDDKAISYEGVDSLSVPELQMASASRGLRTQGRSPGKLREDLQLWLDLRLKYNIPSTLLVLSNAYMYTSGKDSEIESQIDALQAVLSSIPEELFHEIELEVHNAEGAATNRQRLEVLKEQQELIEEENEQDQASEGEDGGQPKEKVKDDTNIDDTPKRAKKAAAETGKAVDANEAKDPETSAAEDAAQKAAMEAREAEGEGLAHTSDGVPPSMEAREKEAVKHETEAEKEKEGAKDRAEEESGKAGMKKE